MFIDHAAECKVAHLGVTILDVCAKRCYGMHGLNAEVVKLGKRGWLVIAFLVCCRKRTGVRGYDVIFEFAHTFKFHAGHFGKFLAGAGQHSAWVTIHRIAVLVKEVAEQWKGVERSERIDESCRVARYHIQVAAWSLDEGKQARTVHTLAGREYGLKIFERVDHKIESL